MKKLNEMTRKELAILIVDSKIAKGEIAKERRITVIKNYLMGCGYVKGSSKADLQYYASKEVA